MRDRVGSAVWCVAKNCDTTHLMNVHEIAVAQPKKMLENLEKWLKRGAAYAEEKSFDPDVLLQARLAPDQFALIRQVQSACDTAKFIAPRLGGVDAPKFDDDEKTYAEIQKRVADTVAFLATVEAAPFEGYADREVKLGFLPEGSWVRGADYLSSFALPNFYFHVAMAYAILRHNGVQLGKRDWIGSMPIQS